MDRTTAEGIARAWADSPERRSEAHEAGLGLVQRIASGLAQLPVEPRSWAVVPRVTPEREAVDGDVTVLLLTDTALVSCEIDVPRLEAWEIALTAFPFPLAVLQWAVVVQWFGAGEEPFTERHVTVLQSGEATVAVLGDERLEGREPDREARAFRDAVVAAIDAATPTG
ncbi:hypothetical protein [Paraconexibacter algicola]|uniref:Uncharacterized protein n=1 Tax=Paraconexibacter algicola TaxID=2133960 RepID=A0A2T4UB58_9ACTN|nr:hypothetical protein [Paraconexibacter algicola]PTL54103.1 hypothetical protein C7Y72_22060 [Paraconexibacter algicola]